MTNSEIKYVKKFLYHHKLDYYCDDNLIVVEKYNFAIDTKGDMVSQLVNLTEIILNDHQKEIWG